jgi:F0F1-type ATP synthase delta subunit
MSETYRYEVEFVVPDGVDGENIELVMNEYFGDLVETDRFIDARIITESTLSDEEKERLRRMVDNTLEEDIERAADLVRALREDNSQ